MLADNEIDTLYGRMSVDGMTRRKLLQGAMALVATTLTAPMLTHAASDLSEGLQQISAKLCGAQLRDPSLGRSYADYLVRRFGEETVQHLVNLVMASAEEDLDGAITQAGLDAVADEVVVTFYTGSITRSDGQQDQIHYLQALAWQVLSFTKPPGMCGGVFGYWAKPPQTIAAAN